MPRDREFAPVGMTPLVASGLIAAASRKDLSGKKGKRAKITREGWQTQCWYFYDVIGEYYYAVNWVGNLLSRATLVIHKNGKLVNSGPAKVALDGLFGGPLAQSEMLRLLGVHLTVAGEGYVIGKNDPDRDNWVVASNLRVNQVGDGYTLAGAPIPSGSVVLRIWRPHPVDQKLSTSASRPVLGILSELEGLGKRVAADIDSRLTGNGVWMVPSEVDFPSQPVIEQTDDGPVAIRTKADTIQDALIDAAGTAISDQSSAMAKVPLVFTMPGESIAQAKHQTFWSEFDDQLPELRREAIRRLALGMDMPPEALEGTGDMNHWNAWQLEEAAIKVHTEPLLQLITSALTEKYLWPYLEDEMSPEEARAYQVVADTTELRLRPNRSKESIELYDRGELSAVALLRENGFDVADAMGPEELRLWLARKLALGAGSATPDQLAAVAKVLGNLDLPVDEAADEREPREATPSIREHPSRDIPNDGVPPELVAAGEVLVYRALERAGNRLKSRLRGQAPPEGIGAADLYRHIPFGADDIDDLLTDAWGACELFSMGFCQESLDRYARVLLATRQPHNRELLASYLGPTVVANP